MTRDLRSFTARATAHHPTAKSETRTDAEAGEPPASRSPANVTTNGMPVVTACVKAMAANAIDVVASTHAPMMKPPSRIAA